MATTDVQSDAAPTTPAHLALAANVLREQQGVSASEQQLAETVIRQHRMIERLAELLTEVREQLLYEITVLDDGVNERIDTTLAVVAGGLSDAW